MRKKLLAALLVSAMALAGLTACGADPGDLASGDDGQTATENNGGTGESIDSETAMANAKSAALADAGLTEDQVEGLR